MESSTARHDASGSERGPVNRSPVSVVMPFAGGRLEAAEAADTLRSLQLRPGDELILADNSGTALGASGVRVVVATGERSPAHARNAGAAASSGAWILFLDADCRPRREILDEYFRAPIDESVGGLAGEVLGVVVAEDAPARRRGGAAQQRAGSRVWLRHRAASKRAPLAARYGAAKGFLSQRQHLAHPYRPRAVAANLLVRRAAFVQVGGFYEGLRAAEDTDFVWRLQQAGWRLELRPEAWVEHRYRATLSELRQQWRGYAAGRAWLARRYEGFIPERALSRAVGRLARRGGARRPGRLVVADRSAGAARADRSAGDDTSSRVERGKYLALDALLALEELAGFALSNRPAGSAHTAGPEAGASVVFVAERFPSPDDPLIELPGVLPGARVEAAGRPQVMPAGANSLRIDYREDDGLAERLLASAWLLLAHPLRCLRDELWRRRGEVPLTALAPAVRRLQRDRGARVQPLGGDESAAVARRLQALAGRRSR